MIFYNLSLLQMSVTCLDLVTCKKFGVPLNNFEFKQSSYKKVGGA